MNVTVPMWVMEAQRAEAERREAVAEPLRRVYGHFERGLITVAEYVTLVNRIAG